MEKWFLKNNKNKQKNMRKSETTKQIMQCTK